MACRSRVRRRAAAAAAGPGPAGGVAGGRGSRRVRARHGDVRHARSDLQRVAPDRAQPGGRRVHDPARPRIGRRGEGRSCGRRRRSCASRGGGLDGDPARHALHDRLWSDVRLPPAPADRLFTTDPACCRSARRCSLLAAIFQLFDGIQGVITGTLRGLGDTRTRDDRQPRRALAARPAGELPAVLRRRAGACGDCGSACRWA